MSSSPALAGGFFTSTAAWEAPELGYFALTFSMLSINSLLCWVLGSLRVCVCWESSRELSQLIDHEGSSLQA